jgi:ABC-type glycerol-3-phosphate transport system permease component
MASMTETSADRTLDMAERVVSTTGGRPRRFTWELLLIYLVLSLGAVVMVTPFIWMILTSLKPAPELVTVCLFAQESDAR